MMSAFAAFGLRLLAASVAFSLAFPGAGQNVIEDTGAGRMAAPIQIAEAEAARLVERLPDFTKPAASAEAQRVARKLEAHVTEFLAGWPWMPFHHTLGISGYEVYFDHPDEMFVALSLALPSLSKPTAERTKAFLAAELVKWPPYTLDGFDRQTGRPRESYDVPPSLRLRGRGQAKSALGTYAFWAYCHLAGDAVAARSHWPAVQARVKPMLEADYRFDIAKRDYANDEAERLNGDLAGLVGFARLALLNRDHAARVKATRRLAQLLELRVNLERVNPKLLDKTNSSTKHLHVSKLTRFCSLTPEVGDALARLTDGCGAAHLQSFCEARNAWYLAFGERMIGGENYTNPLHFRRALFDGAVFVEQLPAGQVLSFVDVPHGKGDFFFIEQCAVALWADAGRFWGQLP
ncbi:MAG: hypothetical protein HZA90_25550 [Verrucomicrobia bacterium]|nr:hypothetical protein [Verrucomicrobiota bacterium]